LRFEAAEASESAPLGIGRAAAPPCPAPAGQRAQRPAGQLGGDRQGLRPLGASRQHPAGLRSRLENVRLRRHLGRAEDDFADRSGGPLLRFSQLCRRYAYSDNYLIDLKHAVIMDVEATTAIRQAEVGAAKTMLDRTAAQFDVTPSRLVADGAMAQPRWSGGWWTSTGSSRT